jgi:hypothetical protein
MSNVPVHWSSIPSTSTSLSLYVPRADRTCTREAHNEFGAEVASRLKLSPDGTIILWPQPSDDPEDPQNVLPIFKDNTMYFH